MDVATALIKVLNIISPVFTMEYKPVYVHIIGEIDLCI